MVIVYAATSYVSRYFPALDTILTFPVVYQYTVPRYSDINNMTNDLTTNSGVIHQRRPSVIKAVPRRESTESECEIDVVGEELKRKEQERVGVMTEEKNDFSTEVGIRRSRRRRNEVVERNGKISEDEDWRPLENKRHRCNECGMRFKKPSALVIHLRTHSGEKPFHCHICEKRFSISGNLRRHMFTHTGEKPYKCQACGRAFNNPSHLARHSKKIHI